ncbi:MAG: hypothetical protein AAGB25_04100, partial [Pseudomonadota bacterium]
PPGAAAHPIERDAEQSLQLAYLPPSPLIETLTRISKDSDNLAAEIVFAPAWLDRWQWVRRGRCGGDRALTP